MNHNIDGEILIITAVEAEKEAVLKGLDANAESKFHVAAAGAGPVAAAASTARLLGEYSYSAVINMGVAGAFPETAAAGDVCIATDIIQADLGAESSDGFLTVEQLGFGRSVYECDNKTVLTLMEAVKGKTGLQVFQGPVLTVSTATGTAETAAELQLRVPGAVAEAMEGFGVAEAAALFGVPCYEIRTVSNMVGPRDKGAWKLNDALSSLEKISGTLKEVF